MADIKKSAVRLAKGTIYPESSRSKPKKNRRQ